MIFDTALPIDDVLPDLCKALIDGQNLVLAAPPGAGKTTRVPLALLDAPWRREGAHPDGKILILEPRRLAARAAAARMAATLGETVGQTVGLRVRLESRISARTRIEVVTEGVFTRMILDDPALGGVTAVLFDEFHERSLDADFGLALALDAQAGLREDLRLVVMSATLDTARVGALMQGDSATETPLVHSLGRAFPVETCYLGRDPARRIEDQIVAAIGHALDTEPGSILVFLPGQREIVRVAERLRGLLLDRGGGGSIDVAPLYGALDPREQDRAIAPAHAGRCKIVLATSIAETSLTIEGVRVVIDSGLARIPVYEPDIGVTRLETVRASRAAADQRRGRAGRTQPGVCFRLWEQAGEGALPAFAPPEILAADLSGLLLDCAAWGVTDPGALRWLDPPPSGALAEARKLLADLSALDADGRLTALGRGLRALPLPPRLARMVMDGAARGAGDLAARIAAVIVERGLGGNSTDIVERLRIWGNERGDRADGARRLARGWARAAQAGGTLPLGTSARDKGPVPASDHGADVSPAEILALAYPDRLAKARGRPGDYVMANGRGAALDPADALARAPFLVVADISGRAAASRILLAAGLDAATFEAIAGPAIVTTDETVFDATTRALKRRRIRRLGAITFDETPLKPEAGTAAVQAFCAGVAQIGLDALPWTRPQRQRMARVQFLRSTLNDISPNDMTEPWPDLSDTTLLGDVARWLGPHLAGMLALGDVRAEQLDAALDGLLPWPLGRTLDTDAPTHFTAPTGTRAAIDYGAEAGPCVSIRVQELFGLSRHPTIARGTVPLTFALLSPAQRPIQVTRDLPGFWRGSWAAVKSDMRGRYPRHVWPDDPAQAMPTTRAKPRGT